MSQVGALMRPDGGAQLVALHGHPDHGLRIRKDPELLTLVIKAHPLMEYQFTESLNGEWEIVFKPPSYVCADKGCHLWHPWMHYAERSPRWTLDEAVVIITTGLDFIANSHAPSDGVYALRHVHTGEIIPKDILCT